MKLTTTARHFDASPELVEYTERKLVKLKRFFDHILTVDVIMTVEKFRHIAEMNVHVNGHDFSAKEEPLLEKVLERAVAAIETWLCEGVEAAMSQYNGSVD